MIRRNKRRGRRSNIDRRRREQRQMTRHVRFIEILWETKLFTTLMSMEAAAAAAAAAATVLREVIVV
jgi:ribosomal protein S10